MQVEVSFDLEESSDTLEIPGESPDPATRYLNLRDSPGAIERLEEARRYPPLRTFLNVVNSADSVFMTAQCKTWTTEDHAAAGPAPGAVPCQFASRVDIVFASELLNFERGHYEGLTKQLHELLTREAATDTLAAKLCVRACRFRAHGRFGYCLRISLHARGATLEQAQLRWGLGLARVQQALLFSSRSLRQRMKQTS